MKVAIQLAQLFRYTKRVVVELPDDYLSKRKVVFGVGDGWLEALVFSDIGRVIYDQDESDNWEVDSSWGAEEGTHSLIEKNISDKPDYRVLDDGIVEKV